MIDISASELAAGLGLHRAGREWRGRCPACGYGSDAFALTNGKAGVMGWCASCQDRTAIRAVLHQGSAYTPPERAEAQDKADRRAARQERALALWNRAGAAVSTPADAYLSARGLPGLAGSGALRFRAGTPHPQGGRLPAMLALVVGVAGAPIAVHRTYLQHDGSGKATITPAKASLGPVWGGAIRLHPVAPELVIGEGIESSASAGRMLGLPAWAAISAGNLARGLVLPAAVLAVTIAADPDEPGQGAARDAWHRWTAEGRRVRIATPDGSGDFNDVLLAREAAHA